VETFYDKLIPKHERTLLGKYNVTGMPTTKEYNFTQTPKVHLSYRMSTSSIFQLEKAEAEITIHEWVAEKENKTSNESKKNRRKKGRNK